VRLVGAAGFEPTTTTPPVYQGQKRKPLNLMKKQTKQQFLF